ncbi:MAG: carboxypeptidase regulatory-like domain-containing protein [Planctomycetes bacterium]|nr:carboxypeptidase regulatory-like domain-containing protein [Planctomycetota bacterium]
MRNRALSLALLGLAALIACLVWLLRGEPAPPPSLPVLHTTRESARPDSAASPSATRASTSAPVAEPAVAPEAPRGPLQRIDGEVIGPLGQPIADAAIRLAKWPALQATLATTTSDARGRFAFAEVEPGGILFVLAESEGYTPGQGVARFRSGARETAVHLRLWDSSVVSGRVLDPEGLPVAGAEVLATNDFTWVDGGIRSPETRTNEAGEFRLPGVPIGRYVLRVRASGFALAEHIGDSVHETSVEVRLARDGGTRIEVELRGLPPELGPQTTVRMYGSRHGHGFPLFSSAEVHHFDTAGRLVIDGLYRNAEWVLQMPVLDGWVFDPREQRLPPGTEVHRVTYTAVKDGTIVLRGVLRHVSGAPLAGEQLVCHTQRSQSMNGDRPGQAMTDADGRFEMQAPLAPNEHYSLHLKASRYALRQEKSEKQAGVSDPRYLVRFEALASEEPLQLVAIESASVSGKLLQLDDQPASFQWMELQVKREGSSWFPLAYAVSAADGSFRFTAFHAPTVPHRIHTDDRGNEGALELHLTESEQLDDVIVRVAPSGSVGGSVRDELGAPLVGAVIDLVALEGETKRGTVAGSVLSDRSGRFRFPSVSPGTKRLHLRKADRSSGGGSAELEVRSGQESVVDLTWSPPKPK